MARKRKVSPKKAKVVKPALRRPIKPSRAKKKGPGKKTAVKGKKAPRTAEEAIEKKPVFLTKDDQRFVNLSCTEPAPSDLELAADGWQADPPIPIKEPKFPKIVSQILYWRPKLPAPPKEPPPISAG
jgi:hypothetical protein